jgi:pimeloyl-ACP methyl ester carboxylesterase
VDLTPRLEEVRAPTLLVAGSRTGERLRRHLAQMRALLPRAKLVEIEGYDYGIHFLAPDQVVAEVRNFLGEIES